MKHFVTAKVNTRITAMKNRTIYSKNNQRNVQKPHSQIHTQVAGRGKQRMEGGSKFLPAHPPR